MDSLAVLPVRRWLALLGLLAAVWLFPSPVRAQCYGGACNPASVHSVDVCWSLNGMGGGTTYNRGNGVLDVAAILRQACVEYAAAHSRPGSTLVWDSCEPVLPSPALASYGGQWGGYNVTGTAVGCQSEWNQGPGG